MSSSGGKIVSDKQQLPTLSGQKIRTRKRDEKEKYDPQAFRESIFSALDEIIQSTGSNISHLPPSTLTSSGSQSKLISPTHSDVPTLTKSFSGTGLCSKSSTPSESAASTPVAPPPDDLLTSTSSGQTEENNGSLLNAVSDANGTADLQIADGDSVVTEDKKYLDQTEIAENGEHDDPSSNGPSAAPDVVNAPPDVVPVGVSPAVPIVTQAKLEALSKYLDVQGSQKDYYRKYGEVLFDILIAGGILAPGGTILTDPFKAYKTDLCVFSVGVDDVETIKSFSQVFIKLVRRYKYLEKTLEDEFKKITKFLKGFSPDDREKLAKLTGFLIADSDSGLNASILNSALIDQIVKDGVASEFLVSVLKTWYKEKNCDASAVWTSMRKVGLDQRIMDFYPPNKRSPEVLEAAFVASGLNQLLEYQKAGLGDKAKKELQNEISKMIKDTSASNKEIIAVVKDAMSKNNMAESDVVVLVWNTLMNCVEWNKKEELVADQALKHLKGYTSLLESFTSSVKSELALMNRVQEFSYENQNFLKVFSKIVHLFYKTDVLSEDAILKWYKDSHSPKGKSVFLEHMKKFVEWLQSADEESGDE